MLLHEDAVGFREDADSGSNGGEQKLRYLAIEQQYSRSGDTLYGRDQRWNRSGKPSGEV